MKKIMSNEQAVNIIEDACLQHSLTPEQALMLFTALDNAYPDVFEDYIDSILKEMRDKDDEDDNEDDDIATDRKLAN